jgi:hypothetical protein
VVAAEEEVAAADGWHRPGAAAAVEVLASPLDLSQGAAVVVAVVAVDEAAVAGVPVPPGAAVMVVAPVPNPERPALAAAA